MTDRWEFAEKIEMKVTPFALTAAVTALSLVVGRIGWAQEAEEKSPPPAAVTLFQNVRILNTRNGTLSARRNVLVHGNKIERISTSTIRPDGPATVIDAGGRTLMPGLIDAHFHTALAAIPRHIAHYGEIGYLNLLAGREARALLLRGFTTVRDLGGASFALKRAIDEGVIDGPRIYPSGAAISQTGGHGDVRSQAEIPRAVDVPLSQSERIGQTAIADGDDAVLLRVREQFMQGATQIKLMAGGGVASDFDPLDVTQYTESELKAAVAAAENWGTYVAVHAYTPRAIRTAIQSGVKCIEHGHLADEATAKLMAEKGIWWSIQPFVGDEFVSRFEGINRQKAMRVVEGTDNAYKLAKKYQIKTAWGSDVVFSPHLMKDHGKQLTKLLAWYTPAEILKMATVDNAELAALCGPRNPYPGQLGVVEEGALADLLVVDGDPLSNLQLVEEPDKNFLVIMKDGKIYKNTLTTAVQR
jgi:imidazolonepropionase-like amidohydrolase